MPLNGQRSLNNAAQSPARNVKVQNTPNMSNNPNALVPNRVNGPMPNTVNVPIPNAVNFPMPNAVNFPMPNAPMLPQPEPINEMNVVNVQGSMGNNAMINALNGGNNGVNMNSVAQIWNMASNAMNADTTSNEMSMGYPTSGQMKPGLSMY